MKVSCVSIDLINADKPPAALAFLAGACEKVGVEYQCISLNSSLISQLSTRDYNLLYSKLKVSQIHNFSNIISPVIERIIKEIKQFNSSTILISAFSYLQYPLVEFFLTQIRHTLPNCTTIIGGPGVASQSGNTTNGKKLLDKNLVDYYCLGEGDELIIDFLHGRRDMLGLNSKQHQIETWVPQIEQLDTAYLLPSYKKIQVDKYINLENKQNSIFSLSTSRGCVRSCSFCDVGKTWKKFRYRSGNNVANEILKHHQEVGAINFTIVDSLINGSLKSFKDFNTCMIKLKKEYPSLSEFSYNGMFIVRDRHNHPEEFFRDMAQAGCESLAIGVETGSDRLRFDMNKKFTNEDLDYHLDMCDRYGIRNTLLTFVGYPTETREDFTLTLRMLDRYQKYLINNTIIGINHAGVFGLLTDTPIYEQREELGIHIDNVNNSVLNWHNLNNPELTIKERILRDIEFRQYAIKLRYPIPYADRYLEYLKNISPEFVPTSD